MDNKNKNWGGIMDYGYVMLSYPLLKKHTYKDAVVLCHLMAEYNFALRHRYAYDQQFLINIEDMSMRLNLTCDDVLKAIYLFEGLNLLKILPSAINNRNILQIFPKRVNEYLDLLAHEYNSVCWYSGLRDVQGAWYDDKNFCKSTKILQKCVSNSVQDIPTVVFDICDSQIRKYEKETLQNFWTDENEYRQLQKVINETEYASIEIVYFVFEKIEKAKNKDNNYIELTNNTENFTNYAQN